MKLLLAFILGASLAHSYTGPVAGVYTTTGTAADVQAAHDAAVDGNTLLVPAGTHSWTTQVHLSKGIKLQGAGSGRVVAMSTSSVSFGTGSKVFTVTSARAAQNIAATPPTIANGTTVRIWQLTTDKSGEYMLGTTSLSGDQLTVNVTTNTGSGTEIIWLIATEPSTIVNNAYVSAAGDPIQDFMLRLSEDADASVEVSGIQFGHSTGNCSLMGWFYATGGRPIKVHDVWFNQSNSSTGTTILHNVSTNRGLLWNTSVTYAFLAAANSQFFHSNPEARSDSWSTASTMGTADTGGVNNIYVEDCDVHGCPISASDFDANTRAVWRHCVMNHAMLNSHGYDTGPFGVRHVEIYNNAFVFENINSVAGHPIAPLHCILLRGGTGVIADNVFPETTTSWWGSKAELHFGVWNLGRWTTSPGAYSADDGGVVEYPSPRQFGFGRVTGTGVDGEGNSTSGTFSTYVGDTEPLYEWGNTYAGTRSISIQTDGTPGVTNGYGHIPDDPSLYIVQNRDFYLDTTKPGYTKFTYPHPLRSGGGEPEPPAGSGSVTFGAGAGSAAFGAGAGNVTFQ